LFEDYSFVVVIVCGGKVKYEFEMTDIVGLFFILLLEFNFKLWFRLFNGKGNESKLIGILASIVEL
jgi:hypothetical protein